MKRRTFVGLGLASTFGGYAAHENQETIEGAFMGPGPEDTRVVLENAELDLVDLNNSDEEVELTVDADLVNLGSEDRLRQVAFRDQVYLLNTERISVDGDSSKQLSYSETYRDIVEDDVEIDLVNGEIAEIVLDVPRDEIVLGNLSVVDDQGDEVEEIEVGDYVYVIGPVENIGERFGEKTYRLFGGETLLDQTSVEIDPGAEDEISLSHQFEEEDLDLDEDEDSKTVDLSVEDDPVGDISIFRSAIPDGVLSRPEDDSSSDTEPSRGIVIIPKNDFDKIGSELSSLNSGASRVRIYDYDDEDDYIHTVDVSDISGGDAFVIDIPFKEGQAYGIETDNNGSEYTIGFASGANDWPYENDEFKIIAVSDEGEQNTDSSSQNINNIGNPQAILD